MRHIWSVVCRHAIEDKNSNNFSLIETFSQVSFKGEFPPERPISLPFNYHIVSLWRRMNDQENLDYPVRMRIIAPGNVELVSAELTVNLRENDNFKTDFRSDTFQYTDNGIYEYEISYRQGDNWIIATQIPLKVIHGHAESVSEESEPAV